MAHFARPPEDPVRDSPPGRAPVMPELPHPVKLRPRFLEKPWGGRRMESTLGYELQPYLVLLDEHGVMVESWQGLVEREDLVTAFDALLEGAAEGQ